MDWVPAAVTHAPERPPRTIRAMRPGGAVRLGVEGSLSATCSSMAARVKIATAPVDLMKETDVLLRFSQPRCAAHATAAGGVRERKPVATPIRNASMNT